MNNFILNNEFSESDLGILNFIERIKNKESISFETSGTTGKPKKIDHSVESLIKNIKINDQLNNVIWGLTYDYKKIAGSQVILQSYLNNGNLVNLFNKSKEEITNLINKFNITHISATPTFYRLLFGNTVFKSVKQVTLGGEVVTEQLFKKLEVLFPNANITNIYALTEFGTLLSSRHHYFELSEKKLNFIKIKNNHIYVKTDKWVDTGDIVEMIDLTKFIIVGRDTNMINVGGVKVNPLKIEGVINNLDFVKNSFVYPQKNSIVGNVVIADVVTNKIVSQKYVKEMLKNDLTTYETPIKINFVESIKINSTGKIIRK